MIQIFNEDCIETMKRIPDGSIDLILTDPPYGSTSLTWDKPQDYNILFNEWNIIDASIPSVKYTSTHIRIPNMNKSIPVHKSSGRCKIENMKDDIIERIIQAHLSDFMIVAKTCSPNALNRYSSPAA